MSQVVLITGASSGIGFETAKLLARNGYTVYAAARRLSLMEELKAYGAHTISLDITDHAQCESAIAQIISEQGRIDVLFNNAGFGLFGAVEEIPLDKARYQFEVNLFGHAALTQLVLPHMRENNYGKIIMTSSVGGRISTPYGAWYHASKHAVEGWSDCLRMELASFGIDVIIIEPGMINTQFADSSDNNQSSSISVYSKSQAKAKHLTTYAYGKSMGSDAQSVAKTVLKIIEAKKPKPRYVKGKGSRVLPLFRSCLGDRCFDRLMSKLM